MKIADLRDKKVAELATLLADTQKELVDARRSLAANELVNPRVITQQRKDIARIMTVMGEARSREEK